MGFGLYEEALRRTMKRAKFEKLLSSHTVTAIEARLKSGAQHSYLRDFIYGSVDGAVTTFAVVSGVAGAQLSPGIVIILGVANLVADGFSMAVSNYLGTRAENELRQVARRMEEEHIDKIPEGEREEVRQIYAAKGFTGAELESVVKVITSDREQWINTMLKEEWGFSANEISPIKAGAVTWVAFILVGVLPLIAFLVKAGIPTLEFDPFQVSVVMTGAAFFIVGAFKSRFVGHSWWRSGLETFLVGSFAAGLAYFVGVLLRAVVPV